MSTPGGSGRQPPQTRRPIPVTPVPVVPNTPVPPTAGPVPPVAQPAVPYAAATYPAAPYPANPQYPAPQAQYPAGGYPVSPSPVNFAQPVGVPGAYPQPAIPQAAYPMAAQPVAPKAPVPVPGYAQPVPVAPRPVPLSAAPQVPVAPQPVPVAKTPIPATATPQSPARPLPATSRPGGTNTPIPAAPANPASVQPSPTPSATPGAANRPVPVTSRPVPVQNSSPQNQAGEIRIRAEKEEDEEEKSELDKLLDEKHLAKNASPLMVSFVFHLALIVVLALIRFVLYKGEQQVQIEVVYAEEIGEQLENATLDTGFMDPETTEAVFAAGELEVSDPLAAPPSFDLLAPTAAGATVSDVKAPTIGLALSGREAGAKKALLAAYGGTATTEASVRLGLEWLAKNQRNDGTWSLMGPYSDGASSENVVAATSMALLAFQGAGHTTQQGDFKKIVEKGWKALLAMQDRDGNFVQDAPVNQALYAQAQATIAICELYGMTRDSKYAEPAQRAVQFAVKNQAAEGGWRYQVRSDTDTSVTGWFVMALQSAKMAGIEVPQQTFDRISQWLDLVATEDGSRYRYNLSREPDKVMTAEALLCREYLGWKRNDPRLQRGVEYILVHPLDYTAGQMDVYYWYYATQTLHHIEGPAWDRWNSVMRQAVPTHQEKSGKEKGSWANTGDAWGHQGGRLYVTCLSIFMLEVYYRHMPIYSPHAFQ